MIFEGVWLLMLVFLSMFLRRVVDVVWIFLDMWGMLGVEWFERMKVLMRKSMKRRLLGWVGFLELVGRVILGFLVEMSCIFCLILVVCFKGNLLKMGMFF